MIESIYHEDFIGFSFSGVHSSTFSLLRTSNGDRFDRSLSPSFDNTTAEVRGAGRTYYFNTDVKSLEIQIDFAFEEMTEVQFRDLPKWLEAGKFGKLWFDEAPYKYYNVTIEQAPEMHYVCFEINGERIYKGEGQILFIAYDPYAYARYRTVSEARDPNWQEWYEASRLPITTTIENGIGVLNKNTVNDNNTESILVYNSGDVETDFKLYIPANGNQFVGGTITRQTIQSPLNIYMKNTEPDKVITLKNSIEKKNITDEYLCFDSRLCLLYGVKKVGDTYKSNGKIYNDAITNGNFFRLPPGFSKIILVLNPGTYRNTDLKIEYSSKYY